MEDTKKILRKTKKIISRLKVKNIVCTDIPQCNIILCNVGQATGLEKVNVDSIVHQYDIQIPLPKYVMKKGESFSFLIFEKIEHATLFFNLLNGTLKIGGSDSPVYMCYIVKVPDEETIQHTYPRGLHIFENFITPTEEQELIDLFDVRESESKDMKNRQVKHYGYEFRYATNDVDLDAPLPDGLPPQCKALFQRLSHFGVLVEEPDQLTVNIYEPGNGIPAHVDRHSPFGESILSLSLAASVVMDWRHGSGQRFPLLVPRRSMMVMQHEARYDWQHGIQPRTWDPVLEVSEGEGGAAATTATTVTGETRARARRLSLTFRKTRRGPCRCAFAALCDAAGPIREHEAAALERLHVHEVYERIAPHFSATRHKAWPRVAEFVASVPAGSVLLDLGCGNGKNLAARGDIFQLGGERSARLAAESAARTGAQLLRMDLLRAPLRDACADFVLCAAVLHHFGTEARRRTALATVARLLRPGGEALVTVWAREQDGAHYLRERASADEARVLAAGVALPVHAARSAFRHGDVLVPWRLRGEGRAEGRGAGEQLLRYYHVFEEGELLRLCQSVRGLRAEAVFREQGNWCLRCRRE